MRFVRPYLVAAMVAASAAAQAAGYAVTMLAPAGAASSDAWDVNNLGQVVGSFSSPAFTYTRGYIWSNGTFTTLNGPAGTLSLGALGVSDGGAVVGSYFDTTTVDDTGAVVLGNPHGYLYENGSYLTIDAPGAQATYLRGISPDGRYLTGYALTSSDAVRGFVFDRTAGAWTMIGSNVAFALTIVQGVNSLGQLVGDERIPVPNGAPLRTSFIYDIGSGVRTDQNLPGTTRTSYRDINDAGQIAGFAVVGTNLGFVGTPASFETFSFGSQNDTILEGINNSGWLVGRYVLDADGNGQAILLTPVPEPSTWLLCLAGFAMVGWQVRRRRA